MWSEVWFIKNIVKYVFGFYMVNYIKEDSLSGEFEFLDRFDLCFVDIDKVFIVV